MLIFFSSFDNSSNSCDCLFFSRFQLLDKLDVSFFSTETLEGVRVSSKHRCLFSQRRHFFYSTRNSEDFKESVLRLERSFLCVCATCLIACDNL